MGARGNEASIRHQRSTPVVEPDGEVDLCWVDPGFGIDHYVSTPLRTMTAIWMGLRHGTVEGRLIPGERSAILRQGACCDRDRGGNCRGDKSDASHVLLPPPSEVGPTPVPHVEPVSFRTRVDGKPAEPSRLKGSLAGAHRVDDFADRVGDELRVVVVDDVAAVGLGHMLREGGTAAVDVGAAMAVGLAAAHVFEGTGADVPFARVNW